MTRHPPIQIVNDKDEPVGSAEIGSAYDRGLVHRVIYVLLFDPDGNVLLQRRGPTVVQYPNRWDVSAAGHVDAGETYEAAASRETREELGISNLKLHEVAHFRTDGAVYGRTAHRFSKIYRAVIPHDTPFKLQPGEVSEAQWRTPPDIRRLIKAQPDEVADGLVLCAERNLL